MPLTNLAQTAAEAKEESPLSADELPKYPYGLCIDLSDEVMKKLGMTSLPTVGAKMKIEAVATVTRTSAYQEQDGSENSVGLQITDMQLSPAEGSDADTRIANSLYKTV